MNAAEVPQAGFDQLDQSPEFRYEPELNPSHRTRTPDRSIPPAVRRDRISARLRFMTAFEPVHRYLGAYGLCTTDDPSILLVRVADGSESGRWTLPGGGVEPLEHPDATVAREFTEETGITPTSIGPVLGIYSHVHPAFQTRLGRPFHHIGIVYKVDAAQASAPRPEQGGSTDQCSWFTLHDVARLPLAALAQWATALTWPERPDSTAEIAGGHA